MLDAFQNVTDDVGLRRRHGVGKIFSTSAQCSVTESYRDRTVRPRSQARRLMRNFRTRNPAIAVRTWRRHAAQ
jgi:hypothetical protein